MLSLKKWYMTIHAAWHISAFMWLCCFNNNRFSLCLETMIKSFTAGIHLPGLFTILKPKCLYSWHKHSTHKRFTKTCAILMVWLQTVVFTTMRFVLSLAVCLVFMIASVLCSTVIPSLGSYASCAVVCFVSVSFCPFLSSSWCHWVAAACDCATPWTFHLAFWKSPQGLCSQKDQVDMLWLNVQWLCGYVLTWCLSQLSPH